MSKIRVCFLIRSLDHGGAERQLVELARALEPGAFEITILTFYPGGGLERELAGSNVELVSLEKSGRWDVGGFLLRAYRAVASRNPHIIHGYLGVANEIALLLGRACGSRVAWGIRSSSLDLSKYDWTFRASLLLGKVLSRFVDLIVYNSHAGARVHRAYGYRPGHEAVIPNGTDVRNFHPDLTGRARVRAEWSVGADERLVGIVGRVDPTKSQHVFLRAARLLHATREPWRFVVVGSQATAYARAIRESSDARLLGSALSWVGPRSDMPAVYSALDTLVLSSSAEGMPNVLAEAMACEVGCVTTDVGDAARLVGDTGLVVAAGDAAGLAEACRVLRDESPDLRLARGRAARARVAREYSVDVLTARTAAELRRLVPGVPV